MLRISQTQQGVFATARLRAVAGLLVDPMVRRHPAAFAHVEREDLVSLLVPDIAFAHQQGFRSVDLLVRYLDVCATLGLGLGAREAWVRDILSRRDLSPVAKLDDIEETAVFVLRARP